MVDNILRVKEFNKFYVCLMREAPRDYEPWLFPCSKNGKNPDPLAIMNLAPEKSPCCSADWVKRQTIEEQEVKSKSKPQWRCDKCEKTKGSWHSSYARMSRNQCVKHIEQGYNIGFSARKDDPIILGDIDEAKNMEQMPKDTLTQTSRKRSGGHFIGWDKNGSAKLNIGTDFGELRSDNQYVLCSGSFCPYNFDNKKDKEAFDNLPKEAREDKLIGYYTVKNEVVPRELSFEDLPQFFKDEKKNNDVSDNEIAQKEEKKINEDKEGKYSELLKLKMSDIVDDVGANKRTGHPLHESDTDANFSLSKDGNLCHCWRHLVSLNPTQYLCVHAEYSNCKDAGTPHDSAVKNGKARRRFSKLKGDKKALEVAYNEAIKLELIKKYKSKKKDGKVKLEDVNETSCIIDEEKKIIVEEVYDEKLGCRFCVYNHNNKTKEYVKTYIHNGVKYYPIVAEELTKGAVILPTEAINYGTDKELDKAILTFATKWLDVKPETMKFGIWNVKVSYVYEAFHTLNYLRTQGDTGTGKTRFLDTWGHIHYKPIFTTGTTTPAPLFRIIDKWRGTVVMDEADLRKSDESEQIIKILNNGFEKGKFIMRCDQNDAKKLHFFDPFCPKILSTRRSFTDKAVESRCITSISSVTERKDIPLNLNDEFFAEALQLRNKLLMWRFKNFFEIDKNADFDLGDIEPRVKQIVGSYISLFSTDKEQMEGFKEYINNYQQELIIERQSSFDGSIVGAIHKLLNDDVTDFDAKDIIEKGNFEGRNGKAMQPRGLTSYLKSLGFGKSEPIKVDGKTKRCIPINQKHINKIFKRYGYEDTVDTVVTDSSKSNNKLIKTDKPSLEVGGGANRILRVNRNSVTEKQPHKFTPEEFAQAGLSQKEILELAEETQDSKFKIGGKI